MSPLGRKTVRRFQFSLLGLLACVGLVGLGLGVAVTLDRQLAPIKFSGANYDEVSRYMVLRDMIPAEANDITGYYERRNTTLYVTFILPRGDLAPWVQETFGLSGAEWHEKTKLDEFDIMTIQGERRRGETFTNVWIWSGSKSITADRFSQREILIVFDRINRRVHISVW